MSDAVRLGVPDAGLFHGGFPADALLACCFGLVLASAFGGLAAKRDLLCLNRGGDRQANATLHRIVQTRLRVDPRTQDYYERRSKEGKTRREIVRSLRRYVAREVFHLVRPVHSQPPL